MTSRSDLSSTWADRAVAETYRSDWGRLLSLLVARTRRLDLAEDALSEAFARASAQWPTAGVPDNPGGWLYTTAWRVLLGQLRSEAMHGRKVRQLAVGPDWVSPHGRSSDDGGADEIDDLDDERLAVILLCCHPALNPEARSALALRLVVGTKTEEIARLFLVSQSTMAARITRAKKKIVAAGIPLAAPVDDELHDRLDDVCRTIYLAFTAGYAPGSGPDLLRADLAGDAVELSAVLHRLVPNMPMVQALHALLVLQHGRRAARVEDGRLITLSEQDRSLWHHDELLAGRELVSRLVTTDGYGEELRLQACIAAEHAAADSAADTNWSTIARFYQRLETLTGSAVVRLNRAVAVAEADGPEAGLRLLEGLDDLLPLNHRVHAVRADLARRAGQTEAARSSYRAALELCNNEVERAFLSQRLEALSD